MLNFMDLIGALSCKWCCGRFTNNKAAVAPLTHLHTHACTLTLIFNYTNLFASFTRFMDLHKLLRNVRIKLFLYNGRSMNMVHN